jgi:hypothetical protein
VRTRTARTMRTARTVRTTRTVRTYSAIKRTNIYILNTRIC